MEQISNHPLYRRHNLDSALSSIWSFYKQNFISLFIISLVMALIIQYASSIINISEFQNELQNTTDFTVIIDKMRDLMVPILIISVINLFFTAVMQHYIIYKPIDSGNTILTSILQALKYYIPFIIIMILLSFFGSVAMILGILALVVGAFFAALYIMTIYLFILPVMMVEGPNIGNTITRTFRLAHRDFWTNIGWVAVSLIILVVISVIFSAIAILPFSGSMLKSIFSGGEKPDLTNNVLFMILTALFRALTLPLLPLLGCVLYFNGRAGEDETAGIVEKPEERIRVEDLYAKPRQENQDENPEKL